MNCPNCGHQFERGTTCPQCELDTVVFTGTVRISDVLYNKGLAKIKVFDYSGAIECLVKSISFNKNNINSRNLLGLVLYETGHVGAAIKHWVISSAVVKENNHAVRYLEEVQKSGRTLEQLNDAVRMYNQALGYIRQKSDDMAIIQLKKAVDINPKFIDALNLLALCYLIQRDRDRALATVEKVLSMDANNTIALNYYNELNPGKIKPDLRARRPAEISAAPASVPAPSYARINMREKKSNNFHITEILAFIIGALCVFAAFYMLVVPALMRDNDRQITDMQVSLTQAEQNYQTQLTERETALSERDRRITALEAEVARWAAEHDKQERTNQVLNAYYFLLENKYQEAVDAIIIVNTDGLTDDIIERAETIYTTAYPRLTQEYYTQGVKAYDARDYEKARVDLENANRYAQDKSNQITDILYYLGFTYSQNIDIDKAKEYFQTLIENYPNYRRITQAKQKLTSLG